MESVTHILLIASSARMFNASSMHVALGSTLLLASPYSLAGEFVVVVCDNRVARKRAAPDVAAWFGFFCFALWCA